MVAINNNLSPYEWMVALQDQNFPNEHKEAYIAILMILNNWFFSLLTYENKALKVIHKLSREIQADSIIIQALESEIAFLTQKDAANNLILTPIYPAPKPPIWWSGGIS